RQIHDPGPIHLSERVLRRLAGRLPGTPSMNLRPHRIPVLRGLFHARNKRGIAITEFILIFPVILLLLLGAFDLGMLAQARLIISNFSREGASIASRQS